MQKLFSHTFSQNIWRILPHTDPDRSEWAVELRESSEKNISFAMIDLNVPELSWQVTPEGADWWTSLTAFSGDHIFLHNYRYPDMPQPTDLLAIDSKTGNLLWALPNYVLVRTLHNDQLEVATFKSDQFQKSIFDVKTEILTPVAEEINLPAPEIILKQPVRYKERNVYFDRLASFLTDITGISKPICIDYLDERPYMMFSYYIYEQEKVAQYLLIVTDQKEIVFKEKISEGRDGVGQSTMMLKNKVLVYLKNNNEFSSLTFSY
ncbi:DUF4905 domain-containing protein [Dyadobacter sp. 3J3]|uniref:DUF4905 domain-containing protein n=1 Tax=Dyadobacter sp. 3J3 TaxID=2606600 RepID=UPI00135B2A26|nr:DUF4905 domain-containing protein [Dyadobacter sp. 3J3]